MLLVVLFLVAFLLAVTLVAPKGASEKSDPKSADIVLEEAKGFSTLTGASKITLKVSNHGDVAGSKTYTCYVYLRSETLTKSVTVDLDGGDTDTITVDMEMSILHYGENWTWDVSPRE